VEQLKSLRKGYTETLLQETKSLIRQASLTARAAEGLDLSTAHTWGDIMFKTRNFLFAYYGVETASALKARAGSSNQVPAEHQAILLEAIRRVYHALAPNKRNSFFDRNTMRVLVEFIGEQGAEDCKKSVSG
jgi:hypothetical protein